MPGTPFFSVCIPTYNRPAKLRRLLEALLPQLTDSCELVILDNHSEPPIESAIHDLMANFKTCPVRVVRNAVNVGANANILRCLEMATGTWVWITGDDDLPMENAVTVMLEEAQANPDTLFINFASTLLELTGVSRKKPTRAEGLTDLIEKVDGFSNFLFISASIFRREGVIDGLPKAYAYIEAFCPHLALLFIALIRRGGSVLLSQHQTILWEHTDSTERWNAQVVYAKLHRLLTLIPSAKSRLTWFEKVTRDCRLPQRTSLSLFKFLISKKGDLEAVRDQLELASHLASMLPSYKWRALGIWAVAYTTSILWPPFYFAWTLVPAHHPGSLSNYGQEDDMLRQFLNDKRV